LGTVNPLGLTYTGVAYRKADYVVYFELPRFFSRKPSPKPGVAKSFANALSSVSPRIQSMFLPEIGGVRRIEYIRDLWRWDIKES